MLDASSPDAFDDSLNSMIFDIDCNEFGVDYNTWSYFDRDQRVGKLHNWFGSSANRDALFVVDDVGGIRHDTLRKMLPPMNGPTIYSSRDPSLTNQPPFIVVDVPSLDDNEAMNLFYSRLTTAESATEDEVKTILDITCNHPLAIQVAAHYMQNVVGYGPSSATGSRFTAFIEIFKSYDWLSREEFLALEVDGMSLMQSFEVSIDRLDSSRKDDVLRLLELIAFVSPPLGLGTSGPTDALFTASAGLEITDSNDFPDWQLLAKSTRRRPLFYAMKKVSLIEAIPEWSQVVHPLWLECVRCRCSRERRVACLRQLSLLAFRQSSQSIDEIWQRYGTNIVACMRTFELSAEEVMGQETEVRIWLDSL